MRACLRVVWGMNALHPVYGIIHEASGWMSAWICIYIVLNFRILLLNYYFVFCFFIQNFNTAAHSLQVWKNSMASGFFSFQEKWMKKILLNVCNFIFSSIATWSIYIVKLLYPKAKEITQIVISIFIMKVLYFFVVLFSLSLIQQQKKSATVIWNTIYI